MNAPAELWPVASLGALGRAKVLGAAIPSAAWVEGVLDAPYRAAWSWVTDLETSVPRFDTQVRRLEVRSRWVEDDVERLRIIAHGLFGLPLGFDVRMEHGFCLMRSRLYVVVMAAQPEDGGARTRFVHLEAVPLPGAGALRPMVQRVVDADFRNLARLAAQGF